MFMMINIPKRTVNPMIIPKLPISLNLIFIWTLILEDLIGNKFIDSTC